MTDLDHGPVSSTSHAKAPTHPTSGRTAALLRAVSVIGPAFIAGAWQFGPGNLLSAMQAGTGFGYSLIWVIALSTVLMLGFTDMSVRIALRSTASLITTVKQVLGRATGVVAGCGVFGITLMFSVGNAVGSGLGLTLLFGGNPAYWTVLCTVFCGGVLFVRRYFNAFSRVMMVVVATMAFAFVASAVMVGPDWRAAGAGLLPAVPDGVGLLLVALVGTNFSINAAFYTGYATRERGLEVEQYREITMKDTIPGIVAPGIMTALVIIVAAAATAQSDAAIDSLPALASVLEPLAGQAGSTIFALGFFGAAFSSMLANATAGGTLLADGLGWGNSADQPRVKVLILLVLGFGVAVTLLYAGSPVQLLILAQAMTVVFAPVLGVLLVVLANNGRLMGAMRNKPWQNVLAAVGLVGIVAICYRLVTVLLGAV